MLAAFKKHIEHNFPFLQSEKIVVAVSGGIDSVVLTHLLYQLKFNIILAHCNFRLRGKESDFDEVFVENLANTLNVAVYTTSFDTQKYAQENKLSIQMAARNLRYSWFNKILDDNNLNYIVTAHHLDDNLETFLINFTRGTGLKGLVGIPKQNGRIVRPLLPFSREQIENFATTTAIAWREDKSNAEIKYVRNKIRHQIVPLLKELNPDLVSSFKNTNENLKESQQIIDDAIENIRKILVIPSKVEGLYKIDIKKLKAFNNPKIYLYELLKRY